MIDKMGIHVVVGLFQVLLGQKNVLKGRTVIFLSDVGESKVVVLVGKAAPFLIFLGDFQTSSIIAACPFIFTLAVAGHADEVETGDHLRNIRIALIVENKRLQNLLYFPKIALIIEQYCVMKIGQQPYFGVLLLFL